MGTKTVGVRELREQAPKLVQRAGRGERIVVTRHGRPAAALVPVTQSDTALPDRPRLVAWRAERLAFEKMKKRLRSRLAGQHVAIHGGKLIDSDTDPHVLFARVARRLGSEPFFIGRVGASEPVVDMPGFSVE